MISGQRLIVVMPAYNAGRTLRQTVAALPHDIVDTVLLTDDASDDDTVTVAEDLALTVRRHDTNRGYGANQKTCYQAALDLGADIVVMLHPDYQYDPRLVRPMATLIAEGVHDVVLGSRILGGGALRGGMPVYKYVANRVLTAIQNGVTGAKLSEYHTGYRAFSRRTLEALPLLENSDDFLFDNQMLLQAVHFGLRIGEISCPTRYASDSSSISFTRSVRYGTGVLGTTALFLATRWRLASPAIFSPAGQRCRLAAR